MKNIKKIESYLKMITLILVIVYINIGTILVINNKINYLNFSKGFYVFGISCFLLYIIDKIINKEKIKIKDLIIILLGIFGYMSYRNAYDRNVALYGANGRNEGLFIILTYYMIFLLSSTIKKKHIKIIMSTFIISGIFQITLGAIQILKITNILGYNRTDNWSNTFDVASGTLGNPNFYSTYILMCLIYIYNRLLKQKSIILILLYLLLTGIFLSGLIIGNTLGCYLAFGIVFILTTIIFIFKGNIIKKIFVIGIALTILIFGINNLDGKLKQKMNKYINENYYEVKDILTYGIHESTGNHRIYVWSETLKYIPQNIKTGIGIDNFQYIQDGNIICSTYHNRVQCFDKAHNEFLQKIATEGIYSFSTYIILLIYITISFIINKHNEKSELFAVFLAYLIQSVVGISVITAAPIFYMVMGFIISKEDKRKKIDTNLELIKEPTNNMTYNKISNYLDIDNNTKNIMLIIGQLRNGGAERSITNLANELQKKYNVIIATSRVTNDDYKCNAKIVEISELRKSNILIKLKGILKLKKLKKLNKIDVSISYTTMHNLYNVLSKNKDKTIISIRNYQSAKKEGLTCDIIHFISNILCNNIVCCSESVLLDEVKTYKANINKTTVIQNFCDDENIEKSMNIELDDEEKQKINDKVVISMARLTKHKGHEHIIKAMSLVVKEEPTAKLLIFGRGKEEENLKKIIKRYHLENNIYIMGFNHNPYKFLKKAKAFVLASDYEGFPNVIIEAMSCGTPIISTDSPGGSKEILSDKKITNKYVSNLTNEEYGILIPSFVKDHDKKKITKKEYILKEAILKLLQNNENYEYYHEQSLKRNKKYEKAKIVQKWINLINE